jgi:hypothetical protein
MQAPIGNSKLALPEGILHIQMRYDDNKEDAAIWREREPQHARNCLRSGQNKEDIIEKKKIVQR